MAIQCLLHFDGANGSTDIIDEAGIYTLSSIGSPAALSDTGQTFGSACLLVGGGYTQFFNVDMGGIDFASNNLTFRLRYTPHTNDLTGARYVATFGNIELSIVSGLLTLTTYFTDATFDSISIATLSADTSYAVSIERYAGNYYAYLNGALLNQITSTKIADIFACSIGASGGASYSIYGKIDELLIDNGVSYAQGAANYTVEINPFSLNTNPQIIQSFNSASSVSVIEMTQGFYSNSAPNPQITQSFFSKSAKDSVIGLGSVSVFSSVSNYEPIEITQNIESVFTVSVIDLNTEPMVVKSWSAKSTLLNLGRLTAFSKSAKSGFVELGAISAISKSAKATIVSLPSLTISSKSGGLSKIASQLSVFSASSTAFIGSVVNLGKLSVSSISAKASAVTLPSLSVFSVSAGVTLIKQQLDITKELVSSVVAYAMNTKTAQLTKYTNFDLLAIIRIGNKHYGVKPTGLYEFTGNTDNGTAIDARFTTHETDYGTNKLKNVAHVYLDSEDPSYTMAIVDGVEKTEQQSSFGGRKTKLARGTLGRWWQYRIRNRNAKLRVAGIEVLVEERDRRIN